MRMTTAVVRLKNEQESAKRVAQSRPVVHAGLLAKPSRIPAGVQPKGGTGLLPLIPYKHISINTSLTLEEAVRLVAKSISPPRPWFQPFGERGIAFDGAVSAQGFTVKRTVHYQNAFLPFVHGRFIPTNEGVRVNVHMTMHPLIAAFALVWCGGGLWELVRSIRDCTRTGKEVSVRIALSLAFLLLFYLAMLLGFGLEARRAEQFMRSLFKSYMLE